jgi:hypothetical protein
MFPGPRSTREQNRPLQHHERNDVAAPTRGGEVPIRVAARRRGTRSAKDQRVYGVVSTTSAHLCTSHPSIRKTLQSKT